MHHGVQTFALLLSAFAEIQQLLNLLCFALVSRIAVDVAFWTWLQPQRENGADWHTCCSNRTRERWPILACYRTDDGPFHKLK